MDRAITQPTGAAWLRNQKVLIGTVVIVLAIGYLIATSVSNQSVYYLTIAEYKAGNIVTTQHHRINGKVETGSIQMAANGLGAVFIMHDEHDPTQTMTVSYKGVVPDTFMDESDVVVEGKIGANGQFEATTLLAKCPSKFTAEGTAAT